MIFSIICSVAWLAAEFGAGANYSHAAIPYWNALVRFGFFLVVATTVAQIRADAVALARANRRELVFSRRDPLTGLPNSNGFLATAERMLRRARRLAKPVAMVYLDMDDQRSYNQYFGRRAGDLLLNEVAKTIGKHAVLPRNLAGRLGGDEFAILLYGAGPDSARIFVRALQAALKEQATMFGRPVRVSIGLAVSLQAPDDLNALLARAELLMYTVKDAQKDGLEMEILQQVSAMTGREALLQGR
jgi:diguanylate cyclase (GGDEF)-like protein